MSADTLSTDPGRAGTGRQAWTLARPYRLVLAGGLVAAAVTSILSIVTAVLVGRLTDAALRGDEHTAVLIGVAGVGCAGVQVAAQGAGSAWLARAGEYIVRDLRDTIAARLVLAPLRFVERHRAGELLQRGTAEVAALSVFVRESLAQLVVTSGTLVASVVVLATESWQLLVALLVTFVPVSGVLMRRFRRTAGPAFAAEATADAEVMSSVAEIIRTRSLLLQARPDGVRHFRARFDEHAQASVSAQMRTVVVSRWVNAMSVVEGFSLAALLVVGLRLVDAGLVTVGVVVTFVLAGRTLFSGFSDLSALLGEFEEAATGAARARDLLVKSDLPTPRGSPARPGEPKVLRAHAVRFGYGDQPVLDGIDLTVRPGERVCLVGRTGAGKSTLAKLLAGLYVPDAGRVTVAGVDVAGLGPWDRARAVAYVPQQVQLGSGTLRDELHVVAPDACDEDLWRVSGRLGLDHWVGGLEASFDTSVDRLSAGERQLVGLLRVALLDASVLVLDEATSDLDARTAALVEAALDRLATGRAIVVVAHRRETVDAFDVVYDVGEVLTRV